MQADYIGEKSKNNYYSHDLIEKINEKIPVFQKQESPVIYVKNVGRRKKEPYISDFVYGFSVVMPIKCVGIKDRGRFANTRKKLTEANVIIVE